MTTAIYRQEFRGAEAGDLEAVAVVDTEGKLLLHIGGFGFPATG
jgi:hypothetical protein